MFRQETFYRGGRVLSMGLLTVLLLILAQVSLAQPPGQDTMTGMPDMPGMSDPLGTPMPDMPGMVMGSCDGLPVTAADQAYAAAFAEQARAAAARFVNYDAALAEGYQQSTPFGENGRGPAHFLNVGYALDGKYLDVEHPESLIYMPLGSRMILMGVMFLAPRGDGPCPAGGLMVWHAHDGVCCNDRGLIVDVVGDDGACPNGTVKRNTQEMMHVWTFDNPDGTFAHGMTINSIRAAVQQCRSGKPICA